MAMPTRSLCMTLFGLGLTLSLSSCCTVPSGITAKIQPFTTDGCSLFFNGTAKDRFKWCECCQVHDIAYWQGGDASHRKRADEELRDCVMLRTGDRSLAEIMYLGVRVGGHPIFPVRYRWGYGWPYGRGYAPLTESERLLVQEELAVYRKRHSAGYCAERKSELPEM